MTDHYTANQIVQSLINLARQLSELSDGLEELERDVVNAREDYTLALAKAELSAEGETVGERKAKALLETHRERLAAETAELLVRGGKRQLDTVKVKIDVMRSASAALRAEIALDGVR